jgi:DinB family protein
MMNQSAKLLDQLAEIRRRAEQVIGGLMPEQLMRRPDPAKWSIAECLAHLNLTASVVQPKIAAAIEQGKNGKILGTGPFGLGFWGRLLTWFAEPPPKIRLRAPKGIAPKVETDDPAKIISEFMRCQDEWARLLREAEELDQRKIKVPGLFPGLPTLRLSAPIPWMLAHERRHLWQAENVKQQLAIDSSGPNATGGGRNTPR